MKKLATSIVLFLCTIFGFSQTQTIIHGRVTWQDNPIKNVDVVNLSTKKNTVTNESGEFYIEAQVNDQLLFIAKEYLDKKMYISKSDINQRLLVIKLEAKPIELDEVKVRARESVKNLVSYEELAQIRVAKENSPLRNAAVYDGKIINGIDFIQIGRMIGKGLAKLFNGNKTNTNADLQNIDIKEFASSYFSKEFYSKTLELKSDEIPLFLDFCEADYQAKEIIAGQNEFVILNFFISKKNEFIKLKDNSLTK